MSHAGRARVGRLTGEPLPPYAYRPGQSPHPRRHPGGHSRGRPEPRARQAPAGEGDAWLGCRLYLRGLELFEAGYWWESHEAFEALWRVAPRGSPARRLLRALILAAGAELKREGGSTAGAERLRERARRGLQGLPARVLGIRVQELAERLSRPRGRLRLPLSPEPPARAPRPSGGPGD